MVKNVITKVAILTLSGFIAVAFYANAYQEENVKKKPELEKMTETKTQKDETTLDIKKEKNTNVEDKTKKSKETTKTNTDDRFIPTEEISEDLAVSFPIDI